MKFDPYTWEEVAVNAEIIHPKGRLQLRLSAPCPVYVSAEGYEALAGYAASFDLEISEAVTYRIEAAKGVRAFLYRPTVTSMTYEGEVFTNIDRMPQESGMLAEVTRARRVLEFERRQMLSEIRAEAAKARASLKPAAPPVARPVVQDEGEAEVLDGSDGAQA